METQPPTTGQTPPARPRLASSTIWLLIILLVIMVFAWYQQDRTSRSEISYDFFYSQLQAHNVAEIEWLNSQQIVGRYSNLDFAKRELDRRAQMRPSPAAPSTGNEEKSAKPSAGDAKSEVESAKERDKKSQQSKNEKR